MAHRAIDRRPALAIAVATAALLTLGACTKVPKPSSDATPPEAGRWTIFDNGTEVDRNGNATYTTTASHSLTIWYHGTDSQGVKRVALATSVGWSCQSGNVAQSVGPGLAAPQVTNIVADANNMVPTEAILISNVSGPYSCSSGFSFTGASADLMGTATNWSGQSTSNSLAVNLTP